MFTALLILLSPVAPMQAQGDVPVTSGAIDQNVPAIVANEGDLRYPAIDLSRYAGATAPTPNGNHNEHAPGTPWVAHSIDLLTGVEEFHVLPISAHAPNGRVTGTEMRDSLEEGLAGSRATFVDPYVVNEQVDPWDSHLRQFHNKAGAAKVCSGSMIDARHWLTAGHCVHEGNGGAWVTDIVGTPSYDGDDDTHGSGNAIYVVSWSDWTVNGSWSGDSALVRSDRPLGFLTGWMGFGFDDDWAIWWNTTTMHGTGYPGGGWGSWTELRYTWGDFDLWPSTNTAQAFVSFSAWIGGMSGGGVYHKDSAGDRYLYANNSYGLGEPSNVTTLYGVCKINSTRFYKYRDEVIPGGYPSTQEDYLPLKVRVDMGGSTITSGDQLASMTYVVGNMSLYNPPSQSWPVEVYLSINDNISTADILIQTHTLTWNAGAKSSANVNVGTPPTIPSGTAARDYWIGVVFDIADAVPSNNDSDGWDADYITVVDPPAYWPNLPSSFLTIGSGITVGFESASVHSYMGINELVGDHSGPDAEAWCNVGDRGNTYGAYSGSYCLEMGLDPASTNYHNVANGLILGLTGAAPGDLELRFMVKNYGEESGVDDGVFVSTDGGITWTMVYGDWSAIGNKWEEVSVDLHGIDTSNAFYVLFGQGDNFPYGNQDGIAIDNFTVRPTPSRLLFVENLDAGETCSVEVRNCTPNDKVYVGWSVQGGGPISSSWGDIYLNPGFKKLPPMSTDGNGDATIFQPVNPNIGGITIWLHGLDWGSQLLLNHVSYVIN